MVPPAQLPPLSSITFTTCDYLRLFNTKPNVVCFISAFLHRNFMCAGAHPIPVPPWPQWIKQHNSRLFLHKWISVHIICALLGAIADGRNDQTATARAALRVCCVCLHKIAFIFSRKWKLSICIFLCFPLSLALSIRLRISARQTLFWLALKCNMRLA